MPTTPSPVPDIVLRRFTRTDTEFFSRLATDERVTRFVGDGRPWDSDFIAARVDSALGGLPPGHPEAKRWFIASLDDEPAGLVVSSRHDGAVEIGYWLAPEHWGKGLAGRMVARAIPAVWDAYGSIPLSARVDPENGASVRILTRHGFRPDGATPEGLDVYRLEHRSG
ncbi:GNAT family N-acetyltransferase [Paeniglutamicibacter sp.]|uniref:GNAT family N-acetyltransferase n=1 Tax=Paeniglutamicibacter sp. TaxID=1934391 RepID=UPI00398A331F